MSTTVPEEHREVLDAPYAVLGQKYGGTDFSYADRPGESRVGVVLRPVRVNVTDLRNLQAE